MMCGATSLRAEPVAILGAGVVTPVGANLDTFWAGLLDGRDGISPIERFAVDDLRVRRAGEIKQVSAGPTPSPCRASALLRVAAADLVARAPIDASPERIGIVVGTALGGVEELERATADARGPRATARALYDAPAHALAEALDARGPVLTVSTACASGATAIGVGADLVRADRADVVVAGGYDTLCRFVMRGFDVLRSLTRERVRPFDRRRSGLLLGEGAGLVLLARDGDRSRTPRLGRLLGHASASDGSHIAAPDPEGRGLERSAALALAEAGVKAEDVDFVSTHGTGTLLNDRIETAVLKRVLGPRAREIPLNSIKGGLGHTMGAAAALEAIMCLLAARDGIVPPTVGHEEPDPECDLDWVAGAPRRRALRICVSTSLGFGGCNATLVLEGA